MQRRASKTRQQILVAFHDLVLSQPYESITVLEIIERAGVARSTFYEHFTDKRALLVTAMEDLLDVLAQCACGEAERAQVVELVAHFWENRDMGRIILASTAQRPIATALAQMLEVRGRGDALVCNALAFGYLGTIQRWQSGALHATQAEVVAWLMNDVQ